MTMKRALPATNAKKLSVKKKLSMYAKNAHNINIKIAKRILIQVKRYNLTMMRPH